MPNIILITIDTMKFDALNEHITPNIWEWSKDKLVFSKCYAQSSWTRPSYASLLTGLYPYQHKGLRNVITLKELVDKQIAYDNSFDENFETLPEILKHNGFYTVCIQANPFLSCIISDNAYGFTRGFDEYLYPEQTSVYKFYPEAIGITKHTLSNLMRLKGRQLFMWINFMDPHCPYFPPQEYSPSMMKSEAFTNPKRDLAYQLTDNDKKLIHANYLKEIRYVDHELKKILEYISKDDIVILTSDHGEEFWDHGNNRSDNNFYNRGVDHGHTLYNELIHVPMIISYPDLIEINADKLIQQKSFFNIILEQLLDIDVEHKHIENDFVFSEGLLYGEERKAFIWQDGYKAIISQKEEEIYDINKNEHVQISNEKIRNRILDRIEETDIEIDWFKDIDTLETKKPPSEELIERLKGLGYL